MNNIYTIFLFLITPALSAQYSTQELVDNPLLPIHRTDQQTGARFNDDHLDSVYIFKYDHTVNIGDTLEANFIKFYANDAGLDTLTEFEEYFVSGPGGLLRDTFHYYDQFGRVTERIVRSHLITGLPSPKDRLTYSYFGTTDLVDTLTRYVNDQTGWLPASRTIREYMPDERLRYRYEENYLNGTFVPFSRSQFYYNDLEKPDSVAFSIYEEDEQTYDPRSYGTYVYDSEDRLTYYAQLNFTSLGEDTSLVFDYAYDPGSPRLRMLRYRFFNLPNSPQFRFEYEYDSMGRPLLTRIHNSYSGDAPRQLNHFIYDAQDRLVRRDIEDWNGGNSVTLEEQRFYFYPGSNPVATRAPFQNAFHCRFANPMVSGQSINCDLPDSTPLDLRVYDTMGREVVRRNIQNGEALELDAGTYLTTLFSKEGTLRWRRQIIIR